MNKTFLNYSFFKTPLPVTYVDEAVNICYLTLIRKGKKFVSDEELENT